MGAESISSDGAKKSIGFSVKRLERFAAAAFMFFAATLFVKISVSGNASFLGMSIGPELALSACFIASAIHFFLAYYLIEDLARGWASMKLSERREAFQEFTESDSFLLKGVSSYNVAGYGGDLFVQIPVGKPTGSLHWIFFTLVVAACVDYSSITMGLLSAILTLGIVSFNWMLASSWIVALIDFGRSSCTRYFDESLEPTFRVKGVYSARPLSRPVNASSFFFGQMGMVLVLYLPLVLVSILIVGVISLCRLFL